MELMQQIIFLQFTVQCGAADAQPLRQKLFLLRAGSNADQAYDVAYECAVEGGLGHWRIVTDYRSQDDFELDIFIKPIRNPFSVKWDAAAIELDRSDAEHCFVEDLISKASFKRQSAFGSNWRSAWVPHSSVRDQLSPT